MTPHESAPFRIAMAGDTPAALRWAHAVRGVEGTAVRAIAANSQQAMLEAFAEEPCAALVIADTAHDLPGTIRAAVLAGCDVFVAEVPALTSAQFRSLAELARRRGRIIAFHEEQIADERTNFVRRMTRGAQALWRARYLRSQRAGEGIALDSAAVEEIRLALELLGGTPERVIAVSPRIDDESGALDAAMITLTFEAGAVATIDVSAAEPEPTRRAVLVCDGRTVTLDAFDARAPLQIRAAARHHGPSLGAGWSEVISEFPPAGNVDGTGRAAERFINAVRARDPEATNALQLAAAASVWEAARRSIAEGGETQPLTERQAVVERPALRLIAGGGRGGAVAAPQLTVIRGEPVPFEPAGTPA